ncbi:sensor histidine kinase [Galbibacter orientalis]|uniref:histidine kinase n=2 Tax=Galbibacter TaxID=379068 RepID=I3CA06_9FLAO|nr:histidine kinase [Galbibacter orientalis]EIJ40449.1 histidine kinase [Galbibacter orientalis DSM 19592]
MEHEEEIVGLILYVSFIIIIVVIYATKYFLSYQQKKTQFLLERVEDKQNYEKELTKAQTEIQEQTLKNISWELHDNVGQLLSVAKMQLNMLQNDISPEKQKFYEEAVYVLGQGVSEIRQLSHTLNTDFISRRGLEESLKIEIDRFKRLNFISINYTIEGDFYAIDKKDEIIIFRIFQECFSNVVKYSKAANLAVLLKYTPSYLYVKVVDDGVGFDVEAAQNGTGIMNMQMRAKLIEADFSIESKKNEGVSVTLVYPTKPKE